MERHTHASVACQPAKVNRRLDELEVRGELVEAIRGRVREYVADLIG